MSEITYTPGPWEPVLDDNGMEATDIQSAGSLVACVYGVEDFPCIDDEGRESFALEVVANARLISAAPDLLEALKAIEWVATEDSSREDFCPSCDRLRQYGHTETCGTAAAIAKAEKRAA